MSEAVHQFALAFFNLAAPVWGIWAAMVLGGMVNRIAGIAISVLWGVILAGSFWYQFVGAEGSARYLISGGGPETGHLVGYDPVPPPWWLPSANWVLVIVVLLLEVLIPIVLHIVALRRVLDDESFRADIRSQLVLLVRFVGKALLALVATVVAILVGLVVVVPGLIIGFLVGLPVGVILGIAGMDFETVIFGCAYLGGGLGFLVGGGGIVVIATATITGAAARRMNETHEARLRDDREFEESRRAALGSVARLRETHRRNLRRQEESLARALRAISGD